MATTAGARGGHVLFPDHHCWYLLVCALDLVLTNTVINHLGAIELNGLAARVIETGGFWGLIAFKMATAVLVIAICERVGRVRPTTARRLAGWAVAISAVPSVVSMAQLSVVAYQNLAA